MNYQSSYVLHLYIDLINYSKRESFTKNQKQFFEKKT